MSYFSHEFPRIVHELFLSRMNEWVEWQLFDNSIIHENHESPRMGTNVARFAVRGIGSTDSGMIGLLSPHCGNFPFILISVDVFLDAMRYIL